MDNRKNTSFFSKVRKEISKLPLSIILDRYIEVKRKAHTDSDGLCPFHGDERFGSFKISDRKNIYKCFACDVYGDGIEFVRQLFDLSFKEAVLKIARDQGLITDQQASDYLKGQLNHTTVQSTSEYKVDGRKENGLVEVGGSNILNIGYRVLLSKVSLSVAHRLELKKRGITDEEIIEKKLFTFTEPSKTFLSNLLQTCREIGLTPNVFKRIPGFYTKESLRLKSTNPKTGEDEYAYTFRKQSGIGIPVENGNGEIVGIQIRSDKSGHSNRYTWFTSSYAGYNDNDFIFGTEAGAPTHVAKPKENRYPNVVFITEGFFKAEMIAKTFNAFSISVSGVGNYQSVTDDLKDIERQTGSKVEYIYVAYDADISSNIQVYNHAKKMMTLIQESFEVTPFVSIWSEVDGKGIDDLIHNGKQHTLSKVPFADYEKHYDKMIEGFKSNYEKVQLVPKEVVLNTYQREVYSKLVS